MYQALPQIEVINIHADYKSEINMPDVVFCFARERKKSSLLAYTHMHMYMYIYVCIYIQTQDTLGKSEQTPQKMV